MQFDKPIIFIAILFSLLLSCNSVVTESIEQNKQLVDKSLTQLLPNKGLVYYIDEPFSGSTFQLNNDGDTTEILSYHKGIRHGRYLKYFDQNRVSYSSNYVNGKMEGDVFSYWNNGNMRSKNMFSNGSLNGLQKEWYKSGAFFKELNYLDGKEEGMQKAYRENGKIYSNYEAKNGRIFGLKRSNLCYELEDEVVQYSR